jgi:hypothetical protein
MTAVIRWRGTTGVRSCSGFSQPECVFGKTVLGEDLT